LTGGGTPPELAAETAALRFCSINDRFILPFMPSFGFVYSIRVNEAGGAGCDLK